MGKKFVPSSLPSNTAKAVTPGRKKSTRLEQADQLRAACFACFEPLEARQMLSAVPPIYIVTSAADSGPGSFRDAVGGANQSGGTIQFALPSGQNTIRLSSNLALNPSDLSAGLTVDGRARDALGNLIVNARNENMPGVEIDGSGVVGTYDGLIGIYGQNVTIEGLAVDRFKNGAGMYVFERDAGPVRAALLYNYLGTDLNLKADPLLGNRYGFYGKSTNISLTDNVVGNNQFDGILLVASSLDTVVGNYVGAWINPDTGLATRMGNGQDGFYVGNGDNKDLLRGNVIGCNAGVGVLINDASNQNVLDANYIGTDPLGENLGNASDGIHLTPGGLPPSQRDTFTQNHIAFNGGLGIGFENPGANNNGLPAPVLISATYDATQKTVHVTGTVVPGVSVVEVFAGSHPGFAQTYLGTAQLSSDGTFALTTPTLTDLTGQYFTATATDTIGDTSMFSTVIAVPGTFSDPNADISVRGIVLTPVAGVSFTGDVGTFTDKNLASSASGFVATIAWGDGESSQGIVRGSAGNFSVSGTHLYRFAGTRRVTVGVRDTAAASGAVTSATIASMPQAAFGTSSATGADGKVYSFGGYNNGYLNAVQVYDPASGTLSKLPTGMPQAVAFSSAAAGADGKLYVFGGNSNSGIVNTVQVYDPTAGTWSVLPGGMPQALYVTSAAVANGKLYVFGGYNNVIVNTVQVYDPSAGTWSILPAGMPQAAFGTSATVATDGKLYVFGGSDTLNTFLNTAQVYDPAVGTWTLLPGMPQAAYGTSAAAGADGKLYVFGGNGNTGTTNTVQVYDPASRAWSTLPTGLSQAAYLTSAAAGGDGKIYVFGGYNNGVLSTNTMQAFDAGVAVAQSTATVMVQADPLIVTNVNDDGIGSLRYAINYADIHAGSTVRFAANISTIRPLSALPDVTGDVTIDGRGANGIPAVELDGSAANSDGLIVRDNATVEGLVINRFSGQGIHVVGGNSVKIMNDYCGTDLTGTRALGNSGSGIYVENSRGTQVLNDVLSGNTTYGISLQRSSTGTKITGSLVGTTGDGAAALGNHGAGIAVFGSSTNVIGGPNAGNRNVISANGGNGIGLQDGAIGNLIQGNYIGTNSYGTSPLGNGQNGIGAVADGNGAPYFGTTGIFNSQIVGNLISANGLIGVLLTNSSANTVAGNLVGTDLTGHIDSRFGNGSIGVAIFGGTGNVIGGPNSADGNVVASSGQRAAALGLNFDNYRGGDSGAGIYLQGGAGGNIIQKNLVTANLGDNLKIYADGGHDFIQGNTVTQSGFHGLIVWASDYAAVQGNYVGTDAAGNNVDASGKSLGNGTESLITYASSYAMIGGPKPGDGNVVANGERRIAAFGPISTVPYFGGIGLLVQNGVGGNIVQGNLVRDTLGEGILFAYSGPGVPYSGNGHGDVIRGNTVLGNVNGIVAISTDGVVIQGNRVGTDGSGATRGNSVAGIVLGGGSSGAIIGANPGHFDPADANIVANNRGEGVIIDGGDHSGIFANSIYANALAIALKDGGNHSTPAPIVTAAVGRSTGTTITGIAVHGTARIEIFSSPNAGDAKTFLTAVAPAADGSFSATVAANLTGQFITATATDPTGSTSQLSGAILATNTVTPTVQIAAPGASTTYDGTVHAATALVIGIGGIALTSPAAVLTYYAGNAATGSPLTGAPSASGTYTVVATYAGSSDGSYTAATSMPATFTIAKAMPTISLSASTVIYTGQAYGSAAAQLVGVAGDVMSAPVLAYFLVNADASLTPLTTVPTHAGRYQVTATFNGDANYLAQRALASFAITPAHLVVSANANSKTYGQTATESGVVSGIRNGDTITATFSSAGDAPTANAGTYLIAASLSGSNLAADYVVDSNLSNVGTLTVNKGATATTVISSTGGASYYGQVVTFTATVAAQIPGGAIPDGTVQFYVNGLAVGGTVPLVNGKATWTTSTLGLGANAITVRYSGSGNYLVSGTSTPFIQTATAGILLLDATGMGALTDSGNGKVFVTGGSIVVDSSNAAAVVVTGNGSVQATLVDIVGGDTTSGHGQIIGIIQTGQGSVADPLANIAAPDPSTMTVRSSSSLSIGSGQVVTLQPGVYVGGINISGTAKVTLTPGGVYYMQGGGFSVGGSASVTGQGVLIYNAPVKTSDAISFSGTGNVQLSAMTGGAWAGITIFQARNSTATMSVTGNGNLNITGTIYAAGAMLSITGNAGVDSNGIPLDIFGSNLILSDLLVSGNGVLVV